MINGTWTQDDTERPFRHPFLQAWGMSIGEFFCIFMFFVQTVYKNQKNKKEVSKEKAAISSECGNVPKKATKPFNPFLFIIAAILHTASRCSIFMGFTFTSAASVQMLGGSLIIFTCVFSRYFYVADYTHTYKP